MITAKQRLSARQDVSDLDYLKLERVILNMSSMYDSDDMNTALWQLAFDFIDSDLLIDDVISAIVQLHEQTK